MVLYINTDTSQAQVDHCPRDVNKLLESCSSLNRRSKEFVDLQLRTLTPKDGLIYAGQGEMVVGPSRDPLVNYFGSEDATTCHVLILRHRQSGATGLAHIDRFDCDQLDDVAKKLLHVASTNKEDDQEDSVRRLDQDLIDLCLVGGYEDERGLSKSLSLSLIRWCFRSSYDICLDILAIGELNTNYSKSYPSPILCGAGVELGTGQIFPATFPDHGPDNILRHVRLSHSANDNSVDNSNLLWSLYNYQTGEIVIPRFKVRALSQDLEFLTRVPDHVILENFSTSPKVEPPYFAAEIRDSMKMVLENPDFERTFFGDAASRIYRRSESTGVWNLVQN